MRRFLAFDLETAKILPATAGDLLAHRPLGIACAVAVAPDLAEPVVWHGRAPDGQAAGRMSLGEAGEVVAALEGLVAQGYTLATWNGLGFDLDVLAEESGLRTRCAALATKHVDMLFHAVCALGYPVGLQKAAEGMRLPGKTHGVTGADAPALWAAGRFNEVIQYCVQDTRVTLALAREGERRRELTWITRKGSPSRLPLPSGWLTVSEAQKLPLPDTSWMTPSLSREKFTGWLATRGPR